MAIVTVDKNTYKVDPLYQWDLNQVLEVRGLSLATIPEVHFCHQDMGAAIVRQSTMDAAGVIRADIPNSLLQKPYKLNAYICVYEGSTFKTLYKIEVPVKPRSKPADYTLEDDPEVYSFNALENQVVNALAVVNAEHAAAKAAYNSATDAMNTAKTTYEKAKSEIDTQVAEAVEEAVGELDANALNAYTKEETLSPTTKAALGLSEDAVPNDAFNKVVGGVFVGSETIATTLNDLSVGDSFTLNETINGVTSKVEFQLASKNYNSTGRALVIRKNTTDGVKWHSASGQAYSGSLLDTFHNTTYLSRLDADVQSQITAVDISVASAAFSTSVTTISRKCFALSVTELGLQSTNNYVNVEGSALDSYTSFRASDAEYRTRTHYNQNVNGDSCTLTVQSGGGNTNTRSYSDDYATRPAFTLPLSFVASEVTKRFFVDATGAELNIGAKIVTGSYVGTGGTAGQWGPTLTFDVTPKIVFVFEEGSTNSATTPFVIFWGCHFVAVNSGSNTYQHTLSYSGNSVKWPIQGNNGISRNYSGATYKYIAIL